MDLKHQVGGQKNYNLILGNIPLNQLREMNMSKAMHKVKVSGAAGLILKVCAEKDITRQSDIATALGIDQSQISRFFRGSVLTQNIAARANKYLGIDVKQLYEVEAEKQVRETLEMAKKLSKKSEQSKRTRTMEQSADMN